MLSFALSVRCSWFPPGPLLFHANTQGHMQSDSPAIEVAAAIITRPDGSFLLARRPEGKPYPGYWEFPGGKLEPGEVPQHALHRELWEELGIQTDIICPWITRDFAYTHATVRLYFYRVVSWHGEPRGREGQELSWQTAEQVAVAPLLPANVAVLKALRLPAVYAITHAAERGEEVALAQLEKALRNGVCMIQIREKQMERADLLSFTARVITMSRLYGATVLVNGDAGLSRQAGADGVHLSAAQLMAVRDVSERPDAHWCGASCHNAEELFHAARTGMDFVVLGPVLPTLTHPGSPAMGWGKFAGLIRHYPLPVFALGGMHDDDLAIAQACGAQGVAMMRGLSGGRPAGVTQSGMFA